jgi:dihydrofolate reductase
MLSVDAESGAQINADVQASDALLLGRTTYDIFRAYWPGRTDEIGRAFDRVPRYVASRDTPELSWDTSTQIADVGAEVRDCLSGMRRATHGAAPTCCRPCSARPVDQVNLWVCPVVIGQGKKLFPEGTAATRFEQVEPQKSYPGGVVLLRYRCLEGPRRR